MSEETDERREAMKLDLAQTLMKTIPVIPEDFATLGEDEQERLFKAIDARSEKILELLGTGKRTVQRRTTGNRRQSERFNTPELDRKITRKPRTRTDEDEE